jgi:hypothetical protein
MKSKLARILRKLADSIDPQVKPTEGISVNIDARGADPAITEQAVRSAMAAMNYLKGRVPVGYAGSVVTGQVQRQEWPAKAE